MFSEESQQTINLATAPRYQHDPMLLTKALQEIEGLTKRCASDTQPDTGWILCRERKCMATETLLRYQGLQCQHRPCVGEQFNLVPGQKELFWRRIGVSSVGVGLTGVSVVDLLPHGFAGFLHRVWLIEGQVRWRSEIVEQCIHTRIDVWGAPLGIRRNGC